jgi:hypothetical protein
MPPNSPPAYHVLAQHVNTVLRNTPARTRYGPSQSPLTYQSALPGHNMTPTPYPHPRRIEGYAIVSEDGMLANAAGIIPTSLSFEADRQFFERNIGSIDVLVHGRNSREEKQNSNLRHRLIVTRQIPAIMSDPSNRKSVLWNPAGASFEQALAVLGTSAGRFGVLGGTEVFGLFLDRYDIFHLSRAPDVRLPGGRPIFLGVPARTPEEVLASHGLRRGIRQVLDPARGLTVVAWQRPSQPAFPLKTQIE